MAKLTERTCEQIREHYEVEKELASKLRNAKPEERRELYTSLYDEFYRRLPHLPQLQRKQLPELVRKHAEQQFNLVGRFLSSEMSFLEVGPGDCALAFKVCRHAGKVFAADVSSEITRSKSVPANFSLVISDGTSVPVPPGSINLVYSNQLMEHLHPDDADTQLRNIYRALADDGKYVCTTPNRLSGPHDISKHFDSVATGFHLKEYTVQELAARFKEVGFSRVTFYAGGKGLFVRYPLWAAVFCEKILSTVSVKLRKAITGLLPVKAVLGINLVGHK